MHSWPLFAAARLNCKAARRILRAMKRRVFLASTALATTALLADGGLAAAADRVTVIYVGGWDCPPCTAWKNQEKPGWLASDLHRQVRYVEIESPRLKEAYQDRYWPEELKPVLEQVPRKTGTPRFLVVKGGKIVSNEFGGGRWSTTLSAIKKALA